MTDLQQKIFNELCDAWPAPLVSRHQVEQFSGGTVRARTLSNLDSQKRGPGKLMVSGRVAYRRDDLARWIASRVKG